MGQTEGGEMKYCGFVLDYITDLETLIDDWNPQRLDVAWDGGELNSFLIEIENLIDKHRCRIYQTFVTKVEEE